MFTHADTIQLAATYLLNELQGKAESLFSTLCEGLQDGSRDDVRSLLNESGISSGMLGSGEEGLVGAIKEHALGIALRHAADQLERQSLVALAYTDEDGWNVGHPVDEDDLRVILTDAGRAWLLDRSELRFHDARYL